MQVGLLPLRDGLRGAHDGVLGEQCVGPLSPVHLSSCDQSASGCRSFMVGAALCAGGLWLAVPTFTWEMHPREDDRGVCGQHPVFIAGDGGVWPQVENADLA